MPLERDEIARQRKPLQCHVRLAELLVNPRNIADDGQVFFITADRLIAADETFSTDVYMYYKGKLSLISPGVGEGTPTWATTRPMAATSSS